jgi:hypothetical protein
MNSHPKGTWNNLADCRVVLKQRTADWTKTKYGYGGVHTATERGVGHKSSDVTLPGLVANTIFEQCDTSQTNFINETSYTQDELFDKCNGILYKVTFISECEIVVTYMPYDHHNEPILTDHYRLVLDDGDVCN